jgi:putative SOS response-associated peptidase YedK
MCGRFALKAPRSELVARFRLDDCVDLEPRYNIPPGTGIAAIRLSPEGRRVLHLLRWGLVPNWAQDPAIGNRLNNARSETVAVKPAFRDAFRRRRCLIPADGFYEWQTQGKLKQPYFISLASGETMAMAGVWESWRAPSGEILRTCCVLTVAPNATMQPIHDRMPVIIAPEDWARWLSAAADSVMPLMRPFDVEPMQAWPVDRRVSKAGGDDAGLIAPLSVDAV